MLESLAKSEVQALWSTLASIVTVAGIIFAIGSAFFAWCQIKFQKEIQNEITARGLLSNAIQLCIQYPKFAEPISFSDFEHTEHISYKWFVGALLDTCEALIIFARSNEATEAKAWENEVELILSLHAEYLESEEFKTEDFSSYMRELQEKILSVTDREKKKLAFKLPAK